MGISTNYYTVYGVKIPWNDDFSDYYDGHLYDHKDDLQFDVILDAMEAEFTIIGKILFDSGDLRWNEFKDQYVEIDIENLPKIKEEIVARFKDIVDPKYHSLVENEFKLITFTFYS